MNTVTGVRETKRILVVAYDLKTNPWNYLPFYESLKQHGPWWHYLTSTWLIATSKSPQDVYTSLAPHISKQDFILIAPLTQPYWGFLPKDAWDWIEQNLGATNSLAALMPPGVTSR